MSILYAILSQWRMGLLGLAATGLLIGGWTINGWRNDASKLKDAQAALQSTQARMVAAQRASAKADDERATMGMKLSEIEAELLTSSNKAKQIVRVYVSKDPRCDLERSIVRVLRDARSDTPPVSPTPVPTTRSSGTIIATP